MGFATIDPPYFMKVYFSKQHLFIWTKKPNLFFFEVIKTQGYKCNYHCTINVSYFQYFFFFSFFYSLSCNSLFPVFLYDLIFLIQFFCSNSAILNTKSKVKYFKGNNKEEIKSYFLCLFQCELHFSTWVLGCPRKYNQ